MVAFSERNESTEEFQDSRIPKCFIHSSLIMEDTGLVKVNLESVSLEIRKERHGGSAYIRQMSTSFQCQGKGQENSFSIHTGCQCMCPIQAHKIT